jgi:putative sigma-54 modulation protein
MQLRVHVKNFRLHEAERDSAARRIVFALGRFEDRISLVTVSLADLNGPRGGIDKQCRLAVRLAHAGRITVEETQANVLAAVALAADRAGRAVGRELQRWQDARHDRRAKRSSRELPYLSGKSK